MHTAPTREYQIFVTPREGPPYELFRQYPNYATCWSDCVEEFGIAAQVFIPLYYAFLTGEREVIASELEWDAFLQEGYHISEGPIRANSWKAAKRAFEALVPMRPQSNFGS